MRRTTLAVTLISLVAWITYGAAAVTTRGLAPEITGVAPSPAAPSTSTQTITVSGRNFTDHLTLSVTAPSGAIVQYSDEAITFLKDTSFAAAVMLSATGSYRLVVRSVDGKASNSFELPVKPAAAKPSITAVEPAQPRKSVSPQSLTVLGAQFMPGLTAMVTDPAGSVATISGNDVGQVSPTSVPLTVTLELAGDYAVIVTNPSGTVSNSFGFRVSDRASVRAPRRSVSARPLEDSSMEGESAAGQYGRGQYGRYQLTGTYQLDRTRSDNAQRIADGAVRGLDRVTADRLRDSLSRRLDAPQFIAIERAGRTLTMASSKAPRVDLDIDGIEHQEMMPNGMRATVRVAFAGEGLTVSTRGARGTDFTLTIEAIDGGQALRVTRQLDTVELGEPIMARSLYTRTSDVPRWNVYDEGASGQPSYGQPPYGPPPSAEPYLIGDRTVLTGRLDVPLGNRVSHQGDRFRLTVFEPAEYRGAVINGVVSKIHPSDRPGRSDLLLDFDRVRFADGRSAPFEGILSRIRVPDGGVISIDTAGVVGAEGQQTRGDETIQRTAVGAALGAIVGAIAGGGKGAAIGAVIGGGLGAGSVYTEGRDLYLPAGTEVTLIARTRR